MSQTQKPKCKYGENCYRKNKDHIEKYLHPSNSNTESKNAKYCSPLLDDGPGSSKMKNISATHKQLGNSVNTQLNNTKSPNSFKDKTNSPPKTPNSIKYNTNSRMTTPSKKNKELLISVTSLSGREHIASKQDKTSSKRSFDEPFQSTSVWGKRRKLSESIHHDRYYFTKVAGHPDKFSNDVAVTFRDILNLDGKLIRSWQFTYAVDIDWLLEEYPENCRDGPLFLFLGEKEAKGVQDQIAAAKKTPKLPTKYARVIVVPVSLPISYGTHHTKMMILQSQGGIRIVIHTANLMMGDWTVKTQGVWISPLCSKLDQNTKTNSTKDSNYMNFGSYLLHYLSSYKTSACDQLCRILQGHDMSGVTHVKLVASVPGLHPVSRHNNVRRSVFGKFRLQHLLSKHVDDKKIRPGWRTVVNCSSIGSLGSTQSDWLDKFIDVLNTTNESHNSLSSRRGLFQLVFPTTDMVKNSLEGYCGGGSVPYSIHTHKRQPWLRQHMCHWNSQDYGRSRVVPHIKTFARLSPNMKELAWLLLTSANLSKAAWGQLVENDTKLRVRSYELGVLFIKDSVQQVYDKSADSGIIVPYTLPPKPYAKTDKPWIWDISYNDIDTHGNKGPIDAEQL